MLVIFLPLLGFSLKKGDASSIENYRPISILPFISKILEKCIHSRLVSFLSSSNVLCAEQFGFRKNSSTADALISLTENFFENINKKLSTINVFVDYRKAFDTINHAILIRKLEAYGIRGVPLELFSSYLSNRSQRVIVNDKSSSLRMQTLGVPQGTCLGPLLFTIYINELPNISRKFKSLLFADDTTLTYDNSSYNFSSDFFNEELHNFYLWSVANRLSVNFDKTFYNVVSLSESDRASIPPVLISDKLISQCTSFNFLGVTIDDNLKFDQHVLHISKKISKSIGILSKLRIILPPFTLRSLYFSLVFPYLNYCNVVYGGAYACHLKPLEALQKRAIRIINSAPFYSHTNDLFLRSQILKLADIFKLNVAIFMFKNRNNLDFQVPHDHYTRSSLELVSNFQRLSLTQKSLFFVGPKLWNTIPAFVKQSPSTNIFKSRYKRYLLGLYGNLS